MDQNQRLKLVRLTFDQEFNFWSKVDRKSEDDCWIWCGATKTSGRDYKAGIFGLNGSLYACSRISYFLAYKVDPGSDDVLHTCDVPLCLNPKHLYLGDHSRNMKDRHERGYNGPKARIDISIAREIRKVARETRLSQLDIAAQFGVNKSTVQNILSGKQWKEL